MTPECHSDCTEPLRFPKPIFNRPALSRIDYRIGTYADFRAALLRKLNQDVVLAALTHREPDDPAIALLEGASILGDILTFYQDLYANEAFLRTAQWRESVADLVRLTGYRLSPGLGGRATFAFGVKGNKSVAIPEGFSIKAQVTGAEKPADFETTGATVAYPHLSQFNLYRPRKTASEIEAGSGKNRLEVQSVNGKTDVASIDAMGLQVGDRIMLIPSNPLQQGEIIIISKVEKVLDRTIIEFAGSLTRNWGTEVTAYRLGRSFKHFGHNAPPIITGLDNSNPPQATQANTNYLRRIYQNHIPTANNAKYYSQLTTTTIPLDVKVDDLAAGNKLICQGFLVGFTWRWGGWTLPSQWVQGLTAVIEEITPLVEGITPLSGVETANIAEMISTPQNQGKYVWGMQPTLNIQDWAMVLSPQFALDLLKFQSNWFQIWINWLWQFLLPKRTPFTVVKEIKSIAADAYKWGNLSGSATAITLDSRLIANNNLAQAWQLGDIRQMQFHEVKGAEMKWVWLF